MIDVKLIKRLFVWAGLAPAEEIAERQAVVNKILVNPDDEIEHARVARMLDEAGVPDGEEDEDDDDDEQVKVYDPKAKGYKRATKEEGIGAELARFSEEAKGTPFFESKRAATSRSPTAQSREILERLRRHKGGK